MTKKQYITQSWRKKKQSLVNAQH